MFEDMFGGGIPGVFGSEICLELVKLAPDILVLIGVLSWRWHSRGL